MQKQLHDINCVFEGFDGIGAIYISGITGAKNIAVLQKYNIKAVVCAARSGYVQYDKSIIQDYLYIPADDYEQFDLSQFFLKTYDFIEKNRKRTNVLVHCMAGISRSVTLVVAYLIKKYGYSMNSILSLLKRKRSIINPNDGFLEQLKSFQNQHQKSDEKKQLKKLIGNSRQRQDFLSMNKNSSNVNKSKSIEFSRRKSLSKQSKQFLRTLKKKQNTNLTTNSLRRKSVVNQNIFLPTQKQNHSKISFKKPESYSSELVESFNVVQVQKQVIQLERKLQNLFHEKRQERQSNQKDKNAIWKDMQQSKNPMSQKIIQLPLSEKLQILKAHLISEYKKNRQENDHKFNIENEQQRQIDLALATKILKLSKPRRYAQRKTSQHLNKFSINS